MIVLYQAKPLADEFHLGVKTSVTLEIGLMIAPPALERLVLPLGQREVFRVRDVFFLMRSYGSRVLEILK